MLFAGQTFRKASGQPIFYPQNNFLSILSDSPVTHKAHSTLHSTSGFQPVSRATSMCFSQTKHARDLEKTPFFFFLSLFPNLHLLVLRQNMSDVLIRLMDCPPRGEDSTWPHNFVLSRVWVAEPVLHCWEMELLLADRWARRHTPCLPR